MNPTETEPILGGNTPVREPPPSYQKQQSVAHHHASNSNHGFWDATVKAAHAVAAMVMDAGDGLWQHQQQQQDPSTHQQKQPTLKKKRKNKAGYNWRTYRPDDNSWVHFLRWFVAGESRYAHVSDAALYQALSGLARCLVLLRSYQERFGMPENGDIRDQEYVLRECVKDLYAGGAPLWSLESIMTKMAHGLTGNPHVNWYFLPKKAFVFAPSSGATTMFSLQRGFSMRKLADMEVLTVRLASFASNTRGTSDIPMRFPFHDELQQTAAAEEATFRFQPPLTQEELAEEILDTASEGQGLFYYVNARGYLQSVQDPEVSDFWTIPEAERELFSRLACREAMTMIQEIDAGQKQLYPPLVIIAFRMIAAAGACGFWFHGSWYDMLVSGFLAIVVAMIGEWSVLSKQEKLIFEVIASFVVGLTAGSVALIWPRKTCFGAMAISGIMDLMQGFRVVYAIIEVMSRNAVAGTSDLMEGLLFTGLVAYGMRTGQVTAAGLFGNGSGDTEFTQCSSGINEWWYLLFVPMAAFSWSGLFTPNYADLPLMGVNGIFAYSMNFLLNKAGVNENINNFVSAMSISLSSGIVSRFTGRQAIACTVAGLYVLLPGAYLVTSLYSTNVDNTFFVQIMQRALVIGIGAWTGSILCSPTLLGSTGGLLSQLGSENSDNTARDSNWQTNTMLFF